MSSRNFFPLLVRRATRQRRVLYCQRPTRGEEFLGHSLYFPLLTSNCRYLSNGNDWYPGGSRNGRGQNGKGNGDFVCPKCGSTFRRPPAVLSQTKFIQCDSCNYLFLVGRGREKKESRKTEVQNVPSPKKIYDYLNKHVIGQEHAKKVFSVSVYNHYKRLSNNMASGSARSFSFQDKETDEEDQVTQVVELDYEDSEESYSSPPPPSSSSSSSISDVKLDKSNILLLGPTGCGKTLLARTLANFLDVPFTICDCTSLTQAGYVGDDIESVIAKLFYESGFNIDKTQRGIVFLDEVDKIACMRSFHQVRDVGGEGVQQGLLKILEGTTVMVPERSSKKMRGDTVPVDTTNILFVGSGAFTGLDKIVGTRLNEKAIGFDLTSSPSLTPSSSPAEEQREDEEKRDFYLRQVQSNDLMAYGMIPEFIGRLPVVVSLSSLNESMLVDILTKPQNSLVSQYNVLFNMDGVKLTFCDEALQSIAKQALARGTGARGLRSIMEQLLLDIMFEIPDSTISAVHITRSSVEDGTPPIYKYRTDEQQSSIALPSNGQYQVGSAN
ncbi:PREDICTED: ATP-dependent Clp protease ATP-binding subunit clpX-like, mitochondrial isoform X2 [Amphimedon queenslandica]|uniref:ClpX-type ZB domain-containing protein n=1 Tax=Amphimedon queenslandica TaxID=400682 RepID=A0A1X7UUD6_AMPQE|nr:PREDICTED: ATP-dependent Clp protease ATP-binding subunit clpX-like, mitochondrial isoform X2 [Amphimedon queenslandica]|eukprot:XP_019852284.1 PREDICTED: ATP-dependent Clp protease ATP-binding subunit clpX-like, mitochondrial isoform X2 [Amphimedon queenslandica]